MEASQASSSTASFVTATPAGSARPTVYESAQGTVSAPSEASSEDAQSVVSVTQSTVSAGAASLRSAVPAAISEPVAIAQDTREVEAKIGRYLSGLAGSAFTGAWEEEEVVAATGYSPDIYATGGANTLPNIEGTERFQKKVAELEGQGWVRLAKAATGNAPRTGPALLNLNINHYNLIDVQHLREVRLDGRTATMAHGPTTEMGGVANNCYFRANLAATAMSRGAGPAEIADIANDRGAYVDAASNFRQAILAVKREKLADPNYRQLFSTLITD
jgi:hypothetical protein